MNTRKLLVSGLSVALWILILSVASAFAASNTVPLTYLDDESSPITADDLAPPECSGMSLTSVIVISGSGNGTSGNDLILGSTGNDTIRGRGGDDCIIGGGGDDRLRGGRGNDVCNGGAGTDSSIGCETTLNIP